MKNNIFLVLGLVGACVLRLLLSSAVYNGDLISQASWGDYVANSGPKNLYSYNDWTFSWPNHPPLTSLYYGFCFNVFRQVSLRLHQGVLVLNKFSLNNGVFFDFVDSFDRLVSPEVPYSLGFMLCLKLFPILADIGIGIIIYFLAVSNLQNGFKYVFSFLFLPFSWYISSLWGQTDQLAFLFVLLAFLIVSKYPFWAIVLFFIGGSLKPTSIFFVPLFLFILYKSKPKFINIFMGILISALLCYFIFNSFTSEGVVKFTFERLLPRLFDKPPRITTNSFNFWHIFVLNNNVSNQAKFLYISGSIWSVILLTCINALAFVNFKRVNIKQIVIALFTVSFGSWLVATDMLDRYAFAGIVSGLLVTIYYPKLFLYWIILSIIYFVNLFRGWWYPSQLYLLKNLLEWRNYSMGFVFSVTNLLIYIRMIWIIITDNKNEQISKSN